MQEKWDSQKLNREKKAFLTSKIAKVKSGKRKKRFLDVFIRYYIQINLCL